MNTGGGSDRGGGGKVLRLTSAPKYSEGRFGYEGNRRQQQQKFQEFYLHKWKDRINGDGKTVVGSGLEDDPEHSFQQAVF